MAAATHQLLLSERKVFSRDSNRCIEGSALKPAVLDGAGDSGVSVTAKRVDVFPEGSGEHGRLLRHDAELAAQSVQISGLQTDERIGNK